MRLPGVKVSIIYTKARNSVCPRCGATPGEPCRAPGGAYTTTHASRVRRGTGRKTWKDITCPTCKAAPAFPCISLRTGGHLKAHVGRLRKFEETCVRQDPQLDFPESA